MFNASKSSAVRTNHRLWKVIDVLVILSILLQNLAVTSSVSAMATEPHPEPVNRVINSPSTEEPGRTYQPPAYEHPEAIYGEHNLNQPVEGRPESAKPSPILFIENKGQFDEKAKFIAQMDQGQTFISDNSIWLKIVEPQENSDPQSPLLSSLDSTENSYRTTESKNSDSKSTPAPAVSPSPTPEPKIEKGTNVKLSFIGADSNAEVEGFDPQDSNVSYFIGNDSTKWQSDVPVWGGIRYKQFYPGYDLEISGETGAWNWKFVENGKTKALNNSIAPDSKNKQSISDSPRLRIEGADSLEMKDGSVIISTGKENIAIPIPGLQMPKMLNRSATPKSSYLDGNDIIIPFLDSSDQKGVSFRNSDTQIQEANDQSGAHGHLASLKNLTPETNTIFSPTSSNWQTLSALNYSVLLASGTGSDIVVDDNGFAYITGYTNDTNFPITSGAYQSTLSGNNDVFVTKINQDGSALIFSTFLGGSGNDAGNGIDIDADGDIYISGTTHSTNYPTTPGAYRTDSGSSAFVTKLNPTGTGLIYSTCLGSSNTEGFRIAVDSTDQAIIVGRTTDYYFPTTIGAFDRTGEMGASGFVTKFNADGSNLVFSTYLGGNWSELFYSWFSINECDVAIDDEGAIYIAGATDSSTFPTTPGAFQQTIHGLTDLYVTKLSPDGSYLIYSTLIGGSGNENCYGICSIDVDSDGNAYIAGLTYSNNFPTTEGAYDRTGTDKRGVVVKLNNTGTQLIYSTYLGAGVSQMRISVDSGFATVTGSTASTNFPITSNAFQKTSAGSYDAFITTLSLNGDELVYSSYIGGGQADYAYGLFVSNHYAYLIGNTLSSNFPTTPNSYQMTGSDRIFSTKLPIAGLFTVSNKSIQSNCSACPTDEQSKPSDQREPSISSQVNTQGTGGDPINTQTGGLDLHAEDISLPTASDPLVFERWYSSNSANENNDHLGYGWSQNQATKLIFPTDPGGEEGYVLFKAHSANQYYFSIVGSNYVSDFGLMASLVKNSSNPDTYTITLKDQSKYHFDAAGKLITWESPEGLIWTYTYDSSNQLSQISDETGTRTISISYDTSNRISTVTDSASRTVTYTYDTNGDLLSATDLSGGSWQYSYDSQHHLTQVNDPTGAISERTEYDSSGRAVRQYDGLGNEIVELVYNADGTTTITDAAGHVETHTYDIRGTNTGQTNAAGDDTSKTYDANLRPATITDETGHTTSLTWSQDGANLTEVTDALGQMTTLNYDTQNNITSTIDSSNYLTQYFYADTAHPTLLTSSTDALNATTTYSYDDDGNLISTTDPLGHTTTYGYDTYGQRTSMTNALSQTTTYSYDLLGRLVDSTSPDGKVSHSVYDDAGYLLQSIQNYNPNKAQNEDNQYNITTSYEYDGMGRQTKITDTYDHETTYEYDADGQLISTTDPAGHETTNSYNALGLLVSSTDSSDRTTTYEYDELGRLVTTTNPAGNITHSEYNPDGTLSASVDAASHRTTYTYDDLKRIISTTDAAGNTTHTTYDASGNVATSTDAEGNTTTYTYDALGRQIKQTFDDDSYTETFYDEAGNRIQTKDAAGNATTYTYDELNRLLTSTDALGNETSYTYTVSGQQATVTDPLGNVTSYQYDSLGRTTVVTFPDETTNTTSYDALGNVITSTDAKGQTTTNAYDDLNRLTSSQDPSGHTTSFSYDAAGNRISMTDANGNTTTYQYNNLNQLVEEINSLSKSTSYSYDVSGNLLSVTDPINATTSYTYDTLGRQTSVNNALDVAIEYQFDGNGNLVEKKDGRNVSTRYQYNGKGQLITVIENYQSGAAEDNETNVKTEYTYDVNGNRTKIKDANGHETTFVFDALNRLVSETDALGNTTSYGYDAAGNRVSTTDALERTTEYTYNSRLLLTKIDYPGSDPDVTFSYDANGQRSGMQDGTGSTQWNLDELGRATSISDPLGETIGYQYDNVGNRTGITYPDGKQVQYQYDGLNRMTTVTDWHNLVTSYAYDDANRVQRVLQPNGLVTLMTRDIAGQVTQMQTAQNWKLLNSFEYTYDNNGNRISAQEHLDNPERVAPSIAVKVVDTAGTAITDRLVYAYDGDTFTGHSAITGADGIARLIIPDGTYRFGTELNGQYYFSGDINHCEVKVCSEATISMPVFSQVVVTVKNPDETLLPGSTVRVFNGDTDTGLSAVTNENGEANFLLLEGNYRFSAEKDGQSIFSGYTNHCSIPGCSEVNITFPDFSEVLVHVVNNLDRVIPGIQVTAFDGDQNTNRTGMTDENGEATLLLPPGNYRFMAEVNSEQYFSGEENNCVVPTECSEANISVSNAGIVQVVIKNTAEEPQPGLIIDAMNGDEQLNYEAVTDENGVAVFELPYGDYRFAINMEGSILYTGESNHCTVPECTVVNHTVPGYSQVTITVQDTAGTPESNKQVFIYQGDNPISDWWTDANGQVVVTLQDGQYRSSVNKYNNWYYSGDVDHCSVPTCTDMTIIVPEPHLVQVTVLDYWGNPVTNSAVYTYSGEAYLDIIGITDDQGVASFDLPEGDYRFRSDYLNQYFYSGAENHCSVPTCTSDQINFPEIYPISITLHDTNGDPVQNLAIIPFQGDTQLPQLAYTDQNGAVVLGMGPGDYRFRADFRLFYYFSGDTDHCSVPTCSSAAITMPVFYPITVTVRDTAGNLQADTIVGLDQHDYYEFTDENGQAILKMPAGDFRFWVGKFNRNYYTSYITVPTSLTTDAVIPESPYVNVTVTNSDSTPVVGASVYPYDGDNAIGSDIQTNDQGVAAIDMPQGSFRFSAVISTNTNYYTYFSGDTNHCTIPGCSTASIEIPHFGTTTVTVLDSGGLPLVGAPVATFVGDDFSGDSLDTDANGQVVFTLPDGSYRFATDGYEGLLFSETCTIPTCTNVTIQFQELGAIPPPSFVASNSIGSKGLFSLMNDETTPVTVAVVDTSNTPQADLTVHIYDGNTDTGISGTTDGTGQVTLDLPDGNYRVRVDKFSGQYFSGESNHCETPTCNSIDVIVPVYGIVTATVLDSENEPQEGLNVTVLDGSTTVGSAVMTNSSGQALFNLPEGSYRFNTEYHSQQYYSGVDNHCTVPTCTTASLTVPVYRVVTVSVVDTANAIQSGLTVTAYAGDTATDVTAITDENGQASLTLPGGSYRFATVKNGFAAFSGTSNHCTIPACTTASITVPVFSGVTVTVVDSAAVPQANAPVFTYNGDDPTGYNSITDASGQATLNLPEGSYRFRATTHDLNYFSGTENNCTVPTCTTAQLSIPQFGQVSVTVTDTDNAPLGGLAVYAYQGDQSTGLSAITNAYGQATLTLPEGNYHFRTTLHTLEYRSSSTDTCAVTTCTEAAIQTPVFGEVTVTVQDTANTAQANLTVTAMNGDTATTIQGITDTNGQATLALPEGDYRFRASLNGLDYFSADANHCTIPTCTTAAISVPVFGQVIISVVNSAATAQADLPVYAYRVVTSTVQPTSTATATPEPTEEPTQEPTEQPEENIATLTELVETGNSGTTDANGQVVMTLPEGTYRFRTDLFGHQYYSSEENPVVVPADTTASITVPVFAEVEVTVTDRDHEIQPNLTVYAYDGETYTGASAVTDSSGKVKLTLPEGNYRFRADQYDLQFWSNTNNHCAVPACAAASVTVLGADYTAGDQTITYTYDPLNRLTAADYDSGTYYHYTYDAVGNRTAQDSAINTVSTQHTYAYDNANRLTAVDNQAYTFDANGNLLSDGVYTYTYDSANRLTGLSKDGTAVTYGYNGLGDRLKQTVNGDEKDFSLDLNAGLTQVLAYGGDTYLYGLNRLGYDNQGETYQYLTDALGSARQVTKSGVTNAGLTLTKSYDPYGNVIYSNGAETSYGFTGEWQDNTTNRMVYLRARLYSPETGRFLTKDSWTGDNKTPMSYNEWLYGYANPIIWIDSAGFSAFIYGIQIDDNFSEDEKTLISETISDYIQLLGSQVKLMNNFSLSAIKQGWTNYAGAYNAQYNLATHTITLQPGWYSPVITQAPNGDVHIILSSLCGKDLEKMLNFPEGSLPTAKIAAKFVLAHEMGHSFQIGNPDAFRTFKNYVNLPWSFFARFSKNPIIKRNQDRDLASEVFADMMAAYLYSPGLLNQQMSDWMQLKMPGMLK